MRDMKTLHLKVRRLDSKEPDQEYLHTLQVNPTISFIDLKNDLLTLLNIEDVEGKVIKIRNSEGYLVPLNFLLNHCTAEKPFTIDVTNVHHEIPTVPCKPPLCAVYMDAVKHKLQNMEIRVTHAETLIPQLQWKRQSLLEHTAHSLGSRIAFLDRRIDELTPPEWQYHMQSTISPV